jgi:hypothetical protein
MVGQAFTPWKVLSKNLIAPAGFVILRMGGGFAIRRER